jgi:hypothetical protein
MKKPVVLFSVSLLIIALASCHLKEKRAKTYRDSILQRVQVVIDSSLDYGDAVQSYEKARALKGHENFLSLVNSAITQTGELKDFEGDTTLQVFSKELLTFYKTTLDNELGPFLQSVKSETFSAEESQVADSLITKLTMTENQYWERFNWAEKKFYKDEKIGEVEK